MARILLVESDGGRLIRSFVRNWSQPLKPYRTASVLFAGLAFGCVKAQPATDTGGINASSSASSVSGPSAAPTPTSSPGAATPTPSPASGATLAYTPDLQPIFASDCLVCHSDRNPLGRYSMSSYAAVMKAVTPGSASSTLVRVTQSNGSMYRYWSGDRQAKATKTRDWVVTSRAAQTR
jgi:hypothetical protein